MMISSHFVHPTLRAIAKIWLRKKEGKQVNFNAFA